MAHFTPINRPDTPSVTLRDKSPTSLLNPTATIRPPRYRKYRKRTLRSKRFRRSERFYWKRLFLLPEPGRKFRGRPRNVKTVRTQGRPRTLSGYVKECQRKDGCFDTYLHPDFPHEEISLNALPPLFVLVKSPEPGSAWVSPHHGLPDLNRRLESVPDPVPGPGPEPDVQRGEVYIKQEQEAMEMFHDGYEGDDDKSVEDESVEDP